MPFCLCGEKNSLRTLSKNICVFCDLNNLRAKRRKNKSINTVVQNISPLKIKNSVLRNNINQKSTIRNQKSVYQRIICQIPHSVRNDADN